MRLHDDFKSLNHFFYSQDSLYFTAADLIFDESCGLNDGGMFLQFIINANGAELIDTFGAFFRSGKSR